MDAPPPALLMTRPQAASDRFLDALADRGARFRAIVSPLFDIRFCGVLPPMTDLAGLIFTSGNGVAAWGALGGRSDLPAYAVGRATAQAARAAGFETWSAEGDASALVAGLRDRGVKGPLLHVRGAHTRGEVAARLTRDGITTREAVLYDQVQRPLSKAARALLSGTEPVVAPLFSPRTARLLTEVAGNAPLLVAAMSEAVAIAAASLHKCHLRVAARPESAAMLDTVAGLLEEAAARDDESDGLGRGQTWKG